MGKFEKETWFKTIGYEPHGRQWLYHKSTARFRAPICGRRFGKSLMSGRDAEPKLLDPRNPVRIWIIGPTYDLGEKEFRVIWDDLIRRKGLGRDKRVKKAYNKQQGNMYIEFPWQTRLEVRTADRPENLVGESLDHVIMSEAAKHKKETWERYIRPALADKRGTADFPTTPEGQNWIFDIWKFGQDPNSDYTEYDSWQFPSWENVAVYPGGYDDPEIQLLKMTMTEEEFAQEIAADFTTFVGKIYSQFSEATHVTTVPYRPDLPNYMAFDFGYNSPLAAIEFQITPMDEVRIWREHYKSHMTLEDHIQVMQAREQPPGYKIDLAFGDAADPEAIVVINNKLAPCLGDPASKTNWRDGIDLVNGFIKLRPSTTEVDEFGTPGEDRPGLVVDYSCENVRREFNNYKGKRGSRVRSPTELPQKIDDHAMDAIRYGLVHLYRLGAQGSIVDTMPEVEDPELLEYADLLLKSPGDSDSGLLWSIGDQGPDGSIFGNLESKVF